MKWMIYILIAATITAHFYFRYLDWRQRNNEDSILFTVEMSKIHPVFIHPLEESK